MGGGKGEVPQGVRKRDERDRTGTTGPAGKPTTTNGKAAGAKGVSGSDREVR